LQGANVVSRVTLVARWLYYRGDCGCSRAVLSSLVALSWSLWSSLTHQMTDWPCCSGTTSRRALRLEARYWPPVNSSWSVD